MLALTEGSGVHAWDLNHNTGDPFGRAGGQMASIEFVVSGMAVSFARFFTTLRGDCKLARHSRQEPFRKIPETIRKPAASVGEWGRAA